MRDLSRRAHLDHAVAEATGSVEVLHLDVVDAASRAAAVEAVLDRHGQIDVLINNAGAFLIGPVETVDDVTTQSLFDTNVLGPIELIRSVLPHMRARGVGRIVNVTSIAALVAPAFYGTYCATKHALDAYTASLDLELEGTGIRCTSVAPAGYRTAAENNVRIVEDVAYPRVNGVVDAWRAAASTDLAPVVDAILRAATDVDPALRYLVGDGLPTLAAGLAREAQTLHALLRSR